MTRLPSIPNPLGLLRGSAGGDGENEFQVHVEFELGHPATREELEDATLQLVEALENRAGDVALGPVAGCNFATGEIEVEFTVLASRSSEVHGKVGRVVRVIEDEFPSVRERSSETEATPPSVTATPALA